MISLFGILNFGHCDLPFDLAQGGELVEPFDFCNLIFVISPTGLRQNIKPSYPISSATGKTRR
jgi:hypothetical protein